MHIGLTGFRVCIPALLGNTDIAAMQIIFRANAATLLSARTNFHGT